MKSKTQIPLAEWLEQMAKIFKATILEELKRQSLILPMIRVSLNKWRTYATAHDHTCNIDGLILQDASRNDSRSSNNYVILTADGLFECEAHMVHIKPDEDWSPLWTGNPAPANLWLDYANRIEQRISKLKAEQHK